MVMDGVYGRLWCKEGKYGDGWGLWWFSGHMEDV